MQRGISMIVSLFVVVLLLLVAAAVLSGTSYSASDALSIQTKNQTFNAAEAGVNVAQWSIEGNSGATSGSGKVNGYTYDWQVVSNRLNQATGQPVSDPDPQQPQIYVPSGLALLAGSASSILGGRTVYVEQLVALGPPTYLARGAITCGKQGIISHQLIIDTSGKHGANIRCGTITTTGGGQIPDGYSYATCNVPGCNAVKGFDGIAYIDQPPPPFLTSAQLSAIQANTLAQAQTGGANFYTAANVTGGTIGQSGADCVAYIGGSIVLRGSGSLKNYCATTVVMGDVTIGGNAAYQALPVNLTHVVYVFGSNGTVLQGTPTTVGIFYVANADVTINGGGIGNFTGSVYTPNNVTMNGGGGAVFDYPGNQTPPPVRNPNVVVESQWEY